jgi:hypothetical protein
MNRPRKPTHFEMADYLHYFLDGDAEHNWDDSSASDEVEKDLVAVFDNYYCPYPTYHGRVMLRLSGAHVQAYVWRDGTVMPLEEFRKQST